MWQTVAILDIREDGEATAKRLNNAYPGKVLFIKGDVSNEEVATAAFEQAVSEFKQVDVIINNARIMSDAPQDWRKASDINWVSSSFLIVLVYLFIQDNL